MSVLNELACKLGQRDEAPNIVLAEKIAATNNRAGVDEIISALQNKDKNIASDCIKVVYEIASRKPALVAPHLSKIVALLNSKNNRMVWGAMTALDSLTLEAPEEVYKHLDKILTAAADGSVIAKDHAVGILTKLATFKEYHKEAIELLLVQISDCAENQLGMYAEQVAKVVNKEDKIALKEILNSRLPHLPKESQKKRLGKVLKAL